MVHEHNMIFRIVLVRDHCYYLCNWSFATMKDETRIDQSDVFQNNFSNLYIPVLTAFTWFILTKNGLLSSDGTYAVIALISWAAGGALVDCQGCHGVTLLPNTLKKFSWHCWRIVVMYFCNITPSIRDTNLVPPKHQNDAKVAVWNMDISSLFKINVRCCGDSEFATGFHTEDNRCSANWWVF